MALRDFCFHLITPERRALRAPPPRPPHPEGVQSGDGGYSKRSREPFVRLDGRSVGAAFTELREITLRARRRPRRRRHEIPVIFSRWESIGPPTYAGRAAAVAVVTLGWVRLSPSA